MPLADQLSDPRLKSLTSVGRAVARERLFATFLQERGVQDPAQAEQLRPKFFEALGQNMPDVFSIELSPEREETESIPTWTPGGTVMLARPKKIPAVRRPLYDPKTEAFLQAVQERKLDSFQLDDRFFEDVAPLVYSSVRPDAWESFIGPYRLRLNKQGITAGEGALPTAIRGLAPVSQDKLGSLASKIPFPGQAEREESLRKWRLAYPEFVDSFDTAGAVAGLATGGAGLTSAIERFAARAGVKVAANLAGAGLIDWAYADKLPGFSADLVDDPELKKVLTAAEGMALAALPGVVSGTLRPSRTRTPPKGGVDIPEAARPVAAPAMADSTALAPKLDDSVTPKPPGPRGDLRAFFGDLGSIISTRLENIAPELKYKLREFEFNLHQRIHNYRVQVEPWLKEKKARLTKAELQELDVAEKNGDAATVQKLVSKHNLTEQFVAKRKALDGLFQEAKEAGFDPGYLENFAPRKVKDYNGLMRELAGDEGQWGALQRAWNDEAKRLRLDVLDDELKAQVADKFIRGFPGTAASGTPGPLKERKIRTIPENLLKYYKGSDDALLDYINTVSNAVEKKRFFGDNLTAGSPYALAGDAAHRVVSDSVGTLTSKLVQEGRIMPWHQTEVAEILRARMSPVRPMNRWLKRFRNITYLESMGSPISAITQIGDLGLSAYKNGMLETLGAAFSKKRVRMEDVGVSNVAAEFGDSGRTAAAVDKVFQLTGITKIDRLGKETLLNSALADMRNVVLKKAKNPKRYSQLGRELGAMFGAEAPKVVDDLANGRISDNVKFLLFNRLADMQPIALSEVPIKYLQAPNGRVFYALKTFALKQLDVFRREVFREMKRGNVAGGLRNLTRLGAMLFVANATADTIKDFMLNRSTDIDDLAVDNILRMVGVNKFAIYDVRRSADPGSTAIKMVAPPSRLTQATYRDLRDVFQGNFEARNSRTIGSIPIAGKLWTWWFGHNAETMAEEGKQRVDTR